MQIPSLWTCEWIVWTCVYVVPLCEQLYVIKTLSKWYAVQLRVVSLSQYCTSYWSHLVTPVLTHSSRPQGWLVNVLEFTAQHIRCKSFHPVRRVRALCSLTLSSISLMHCGLLLFVAQWRGKRPSLSLGSGRGGMIRCVSMKYASRNE